MDLQFCVIKNGGVRPTEHEQTYSRTDRKVKTGGHKDLVK